MDDEETEETHYINCTLLYRKMLAAHSHAEHDGVLLEALHSNKCIVFFETQIMSASGQNREKFDKILPRNLPENLKPYIYMNNGFSPSLYNNTEHFMYIRMRLTLKGVFDKA